MPGRRPLKTGYSVSTMKNRIADLVDEAVKMGKDGRLTEEKAHLLRMKLLRAFAVLDHA